MNYLNKKVSAFTLVEVIVATSILMIAVFGVYKLIWENAKLITNSDNNLQLNSLFPVLESCIEKEWYSSYSMSDINYYDFWVDYLSCNKNSSETTINLDNIDYILKSEVVNVDLDNYIDFRLTISSDLSSEVVKTFKLLK